jgi:vesicle-associated membrane protein 7
MEQKAESIKESANTFQREATNVRRKMCWQKWRWYIIGVLILLVIIFIIVWIACGASFQKCRKDKK